MISEELAEAVYEVPIVKIMPIGDECFLLTYNCFNIDESRHINKYELANSCKKWAYNKGHQIYSMQGINGVAYIIGQEKNRMVQATEPEAIFTLCQELLEKEQHDKSTN